MSGSTTIFRRSTRFLSVLIRLYTTCEINSSNSIITRYARLGQIHNAQKVFDRMTEKAVSSWNSIIAGYFLNGQPLVARKLFDRMPDRNVVSWNALISGYVNHGMVEEARQVFDSMPERNVISWTSMVRGYVLMGRVSEAEILFSQMPEKNVVSWSVMLNGLIDEGRIDDARRLFDEMPEKDVVARTKMIGGYCKAGQLTEAREIFDKMPEKNVVTWTTMINGYVQNQRVEVARKLFEVMPEKNEVTWTVMLTGYTRSGRIREASEFFDSMPSKSSFACIEMMIGFGKNGEVEKAKQVFDLVEEKDEKVWNAMIKVHERNGFELRALDTFASMQRCKKIRPSFPSLISVLSVSASLASLDYGKQIHGWLIASDLGRDPFVTSALTTMYAKCGDLAKAERVFKGLDPKDTVMWNSMITGYAQHGMGKEALECFGDMSAPPDEVTFIGVLSACNHAGKVEEGLEIFRSMESKHGVAPTNEHYAIAVDMLGRAGRVSEAMGLAESIPVEADAVVWGSVLGSCKSHMRLDLAGAAAERLLRFDPESSGHYTLLSQLYSSKGRHGEAAETRARSTGKPPGCSWVDVERRVHVFTATGDQNPAILEKLEGLLREGGYYPDATFVTHDVEDEEKAQSLGHHSEKLAVTFGLMKIPAPKPVRVMKNLRVCGDCHAAIKLISKVSGREIVLRDANRFHRFRDGSCSCGDYW